MSEIRQFIVPIGLRYTDYVVLTPPWYLADTEYEPEIATYTPLINGEEAFRAVHLAIAQATRTVDIICWGFQPSMYLIRDGMAPNLGELLLQKAREGVRVRVLGWEMPFNSAGLGGEGNLPGKGNIKFKDRALQSATDEQYAFDRQWFGQCSVPDAHAKHLHLSGVPLFVSRGFSWDERRKIGHTVDLDSLDPMISRAMNMTLQTTATHHQKSIMVDYELPDRAVGFVMGHNLLDEYWDTDQHSALNRTPTTKPAPNRGARGYTPRQDISCQISGPILEHLHHNFAEGWLKETGEDLHGLRDAKAIGPTLKCTPGCLPQMAQLLRTQAQRGKRDIERAYLQAVNNATQMIYIENQYFRWPPLAEAIKKAVRDQTAGGRNPPEHGNLHVFVITNATDDGIGDGTLNTYRMLEALGRADTMPGINKLQRTQKAMQASASKPLQNPIGADRTGEIVDRHEALKQELEAINTANLKAEDIAGLKVHVCSLAAPDSPAGEPWMPVYIHSKLMIVNDTFCTHGSANINTRSMMVDSELNIAHEWMSVTQDLRRRLWSLHTSGKGAQDNMEDAFNSWDRLMKQNKLNIENGKPPECALIEFSYEKPNLSNLD